MLRIGQLRLSTTCIFFFLARPTPCCLLRSNTTQQNWTDSWLRGFRMLEAYQAVRILRWSQIKKLSVRLASFYYSPRGYWKGLTAIKKLASAAKVAEKQAKEWLKKQAIWKIYLPAPDTYHGRNLTWRYQRRSIKPTCSSCDTTA